MAIARDAVRRVMAGDSLAALSTTGAGQSSRTVAPEHLSIYPPIGYFAWNFLEVGNADTYGFYWPIGREDGAPLVCTTRHDEGVLVPLATSVAALLRSLAAEINSEEIAEVSGDLGLAPPVPAVELDLHPYDPQSPYALLGAACAGLAARDVSSAAQRTRAALAQLPEYTEALFLAARLERRAGNLVSAIGFTLEAVSSPLCFAGAERRKDVLGWLQSLPDTAYPASRDALWERRRRFTFQTGVKRSGDYAVYEEAIEGYFGRSMPARAVRLRMLAGELMARETTAFQERHGWSPERHLEQLAADIVRAGLAPRLVDLSS